jgi:hypothetical protein
MQGITKDHAVGPVLVVLIEIGLVRACDLCGFAVGI